MTSSEVTAQGVAVSEREVERLRAAYHVVSRLGVHRVSLQDIADEAGVSKSLLLYHFGSRDNLLLATMQWALHRTADRIRRRVGSVQTYTDVIGGLLDAVWIDAQANRDFYLFYLDMIEHAARVPEFGELPAIMAASVDTLYAELVAEGVSRGTFHVDDVEDAAQQMRAYIDGLFVQWLQQPDWETRHQRYKERCREGLLRLLGAR